MNMPPISDYLKNKQPSSTQSAQLTFLNRKDDIDAINVSIGNIFLPTHPCIQKRLYNLKSKNSPFKNGIIKYSPTVGTTETNLAFLNVIASSGFKTDGLYSQIVDGGSQAIELALIGIAGKIDGTDRPVLFIDALYPNYISMSNRLNIKSVHITRTLNEDGFFSLPDRSLIEKTIKECNPSAMVVVPYDNPTGCFYDHKTMAMLGELCVKHNMWIVSDEVYREMYYTNQSPSSVWGLTHEVVKGIEGKRISIESASKAWNACGLRIGALVTDNIIFHQKTVAEYTINISANAIGQYAFGALAHENHSSLRKWYRRQRSYYFDLINTTSSAIKKKLPNVIISKPEASLFTVIDVKKLVDKNFNSIDFVNFCSEKGKVEINKQFYTLLMCPMIECYNNHNQDNLGRTQLRISYTEPPYRMALVPELFYQLLAEFIKK